MTNDPNNARLFRRGKENEPCILRLYDMFDGWIDISRHDNYAEALKVWNKKTEGGTRKTRYSDGDYYDIFPANTRMIVTPEFLGR